MNKKATSNPEFLLTLLLNRNIIINRKISKGHVKKRQIICIIAILIIAVISITGCTKENDRHENTDNSDNTGNNIEETSISETEDMDTVESEISTDETQNSTVQETEDITEDETEEQENSLGKKMKLIATRLLTENGEIKLSIYTEIREIVTKGNVTLVLSDAKGDICEKNISTNPEEKEVIFECPTDRINEEITILGIIEGNDGDLLDKIVLKMNNGLVQLTPDSVRCVVSAMTLDEKAHLVTGIKDTNPVNASGGTYAIPRLGVVSTSFMDGTAGVRYGAAIWYPSIMNLGASWDPEFISRVGKATGEDALGKGFDILLSPGLNIQKNPLCGRNFEYFSEDPLLTGYLAAAYTNGLQSTGVGASIKHYAANNQETSRGQVSANVTERALREIYLKAFGIAIDLSNPYTVMSSYNCINGSHTSVCKDLLNGILR